MQIEINQRRALRGQRLFTDAEAVVESLPDSIEKTALRAILSDAHTFVNVLYQRAGGGFTDDPAQVAAVDQSSTSPILLSGGGTKD